jgi:7-cyano-7-deazaguanine synthase
MLAMAVAEGHACMALSFDYGQRHRVELACAVDVAASCGVKHRVIQIDAAALHGSSLTGGADVEHGRSDGQIETGIPDTYVPARNLVFLSMALAMAETAGARHVYIGANAVDYSGYPDCRRAFLDSFEATANVATRAGVQGEGFRIHAPLLDMSKGEIIRCGLERGVDFSLTSSCYDPGSDGEPCGDCDSCILRARGFAQAGVADPRVSRASSGSTA